MRFSNYCVSLIISSRPSFRICLMASNGVKPCVSLVDDAKAVEDAAIVLEETLEKFQDSHGLSRKDLAPLRLVSNVLTNVTSSVKRNAKALSPGNGDPEWIAKRKERDRKVIRLSNGPIPQSRKSTPTGSMEHYNREKAQNNKENDGRRQESAPFQPNFAPPVASRTRNTPLIPSPCNGFEFECVEAMRILARTTANLRPLLIHWHEKRWIPVHFRTCHILLKKHNAGESVAWKGAAVDGTNRGRKTFCSTDELLEGCRDIQEAKHRAIALDDVKDVLTAVNRKHKIENGTWAHGDSATPSTRTISRYFAFAAEELNVKLSNGELQAKTNTRYTAENSLMSAMSFLLVQAISGLIVGKPHSKTKPVDTATDGAQVLADLVRNANGNVSVYPVQPGMITTTDDATVFACLGVADQSGTQWKLLDADETCSLRSACVVDKDGAKNRLFGGQRVRLTQTMAGNGHMAPVEETILELLGGPQPSTLAQAKLEQFNGKRCEFA